MVIVCSVFLNLRAIECWALPAPAAHLDCSHAGNPHAVVWPEGLADRKHAHVGVTMRLDVLVETVGLQKVVTDVHVVLEIPYLVHCSCRYEDGLPGILWNDLTMHEHRFIR